MAEIEDLLLAGNNGVYYILDSAPVDSQLEVLDTDIPSWTKN